MNCNLNNTCFLTVLGDPWERVETHRLRSTALGTIDLLSSAGNLWSRVSKLRAAWVLCLLFLGLRKNPLTFQLLPHSCWDDFFFHKMMQRLCPTVLCSHFESLPFKQRLEKKKLCGFCLSKAAKICSLTHWQICPAPHLTFALCLIPRAGDLSSYQVLVLDKSCLP